jgi:tight adherence protein B
VTGWLPVALAASAAGLAAGPAGDGARRLAAFAPVSRERAGRLTVGIASAAGLVVLLDPIVALLVITGLALVRRSVRGRRQHAARQRERIRALDALSMLGADLRVGRSPADAFAAAAEIACGDCAVALAAAGAAARLGGDVASVLVAEGSPVASVLRSLAACWQVCSDAGSGLADAVERIERGMRADEEQRRGVAAELAGPRATAQLLAGLPVVGVVLAAALGAHPLHVLLRTPVGLGCLAVGLALDGLGVAWTRRMTERAMP